MKVQFDCRERGVHCQSTETHKDKKASTSGDSDDADNECESTARNNCNADGSHCNDDAPSASGDKDDADNECESTERNNCNADGSHCTDDALKPGRTNLISLLQVVNMALTSSPDRATIDQNQVTM